jgi:hypothetical protein
MTDFHGHLFFKMADAKKLRFSKPPILKTNSQKFQGLVLGLEGLIDAKGIDVAQFKHMVERLSHISSKTGKKCICTTERKGNAKIFKLKAFQSKK